MNLLREYIRKALWERADDYEWAYLLTTPFSARNALAAYYCDYYDADRILEVGGYRNPIHQFYKEPASRITIVDPLVTESRQIHQTAGNTCEVVQLRGRLHEVDIEPHDTVVCLGMSVYDSNFGEQSSYEVFNCLCNEAETVILGVPVEWEESVDQANKLISTLPHEKSVDISMDFSNSDVEDVVQVHNKRRFLVFRNKKR